MPDFYSYLLPVPWLNSDTAKFIGIGLLILSLAWTVIAQMQMGNSWRIGIDEEKKTALIQTGVFSFSRNPIFLGMSITSIGFFLTIPNAATLLILVLGFVLMQIQVRTGKCWFFPVCPLYKLTASRAAGMRFETRIPRLVVR